MHHGDLRGLSKQLWSFGFADQYCIGTWMISLCIKSHRIILLRASHAMLVVLMLLFALLCCAKANNIRLDMTLPCMISMTTPMTGDQLVLYYPVIYYFII